MTLIYLENKTKTTETAWTTYIDTRWHLSWRLGQSIVKQVTISWVTLVESIVTEVLISCLTYIHTSSVSRISSNQGNSSQYTLCYSKPYSFSGGLVNTLRAAGCGLDYLSASAWKKKSLSWTVITNLERYAIMSVHILSACFTSVRVLWAFCQRFVSILSAFCQRFVSVLSAFCQRFVSVLSAFCWHLSIGVDILLLLLVGKYYLWMVNTNPVS